MLLHKVYPTPYNMRASAKPKPSRPRVRRRTTLTLDALMIPETAEMCNR